MPVLNIPGTGIIERFQLHLPERRFTRDTGTTLYSILSGLADVLVLPQNLMDFVWTMTHIASATGTYLDDLIQPYTGFRRKSGETDSAYRDRYYNFCFNYNISPTGVSQIVTDYLGYSGEQREVDFEDTAYFGPTGYFTNDSETLLGAEDPEKFVGYIIFSSEPVLSLLPDLAEALDHVRMSGTKIYLIWPFYGTRTYSAFERMYWSDDLVQAFSYPTSTQTIVNYSSVQVGISFTDTINFSSTTRDKITLFDRVQTSGSTTNVTGYPSDFRLTEVASSLDYTVIDHYAFMTKREIFNSSVGPVYYVDTLYSVPYGVNPISITRTKYSGGAGYNSLTGAGYTSLTGMAFYNVENSNSYNLSFSFNGSGQLSSMTGTSNVSGQYFIETRKFSLGQDIGFTRSTKTSGGTTINLQTGTVLPLGPVVQGYSPNVIDTIAYTTGILSGFSTGTTFSNSSLGPASGVSVISYNSSGVMTGYVRTFSCPTGTSFASYFWQPVYIIEYSDNKKGFGNHSSSQSLVQYNESDSATQAIYENVINNYDVHGRNTSYQRQVL